MFAARTLGRKALGTRALAIMLPFENLPTKAGQTRWTIWGLRLLGKEKRRQKHTETVHYFASRDEALMAAQEHVQTANRATTYEIWRLKANLESRKS